jgi:hypothetical protein
VLEHWLSAFIVGKSFPQKKDQCLLKITETGFAPVLVRGEALQDMAANPHLNDAWLR